MAVVGTVSTSAFVAPAMADEGISVTPYVGLRTGAVFNHVGNIGDGLYIDYDNSYTLSAYAGLHFPMSEGFAINTDLEYFYNGKSDLKLTIDDYTYDDKIEGKIQGVLFNTYVQFNPNGFVSPYLGVGLGRSKLTITATNGELDVDGSETSSSAQVTAGLQFNLSKNLAIDTNARYIRYDTDYNSINWVVGAKYSF